MKEIHGNNIWFFNNGQTVPTGDESRNWNACKSYGFISAGQTKKDYTYARKPKTHDILCVYQSKVGYIGIGVVEKPALPINQFYLEDGKSLRNRPGIIMGDRRNHGLFHLEEDPILCEQVLRIEWKEVDKNPLWMEDDEPGFFARINTCFLLNNEPATLKRLQNHFDIIFISNNF
ncbi:MAG: hypothetical protein EOP48_10665 [Sphingobacteriales bacterium]|nr:MAG: hypothetical protein EOP48_10665 [Sphingobacteriales bacterium]